MNFSVIMPCYNAGPWIAQALRSAAAQTLPPHEIIVIDDGSTDDSVEQIKNSGVEVRLLRTNRANGAGARNTGIEAATGDWVAFLDADDEWLPHHLETAASVIGPTDVAYMALQDFFYEDGSEHKTPNEWPVEGPTPGLTDEDLARFWRDTLRYYMTTVCVRLDRLREVGAFDAQQVRRHDIDMFMRVVKGHTWAYNPSTTARYRADNPTSIGRTSWASSEYFAHRAMRKNLDAYPALAPLVRDCARRCLASAITNGSREDRVRAKKAAWGDVSPRARLAFRVGLLCPPLFRFLNSRRRKRLIESQANRGAIGQASRPWIEGAGAQGGQ